MSEMFYWTGVAVWASGGIAAVSSLLWYLALKSIANAGELADYARFSVRRRNKTEIEGGK